MDNPTMPDPGPTDDFGRNSSSEWTIERGLVSRSQLQPPATDSLLQPDLADGTSLLEESKVLLALRQKIGELEVHLQEAKRDVDRKAVEVKRLKRDVDRKAVEVKRLKRDVDRKAVEVKRLERQNSDSQKKRKALARKLGLKLGESERENRLLVSQVEALEREKRSREQKLDQAQKGKELSERMVDALGLKLGESEREKGLLVSQVEALERENRSLEQKLDQAQKCEELSERMVDALQIEKRSPGQKPEQCQKGKELCEQQVDALPKENRSPEQKLDPSRQKELLGRDCKDIGQANPVAPKQKIYLGCKIDASQEHLDLRQLTKEFNQSAPGKQINTMLMSKVHSDPQSSPAFKDLVLKDPFDKDITTFSGTVIFWDSRLAYVKESLEKHMNLPNISLASLSQIRDQIKSAENKLFLLHMVAKKINCPELQWTAAHSEGYFYLCLIVAKVHEACHRCMTNASLNGLNKCASDGDYDDVHATVRRAVQAAVRLVRIKLAIKI